MKSFGLYHFNPMVLALQRIYLAIILGAELNPIDYTSQFYVEAHPDRVIKAPVVGGESALYR